MSNQQNINQNQEIITNIRNFSQKVASLENQITNANDSLKEKLISNFNQLTTKFKELFELQENNNNNNTQVVQKQYDKQGVLMIYPSLAGGQEITNDQIEYEFSTHNTGTRDSFYGRKFSAVNAEATFYGQTELSKETEQICFKLLGGPHNDHNPKAGRCYAIGVNINGTAHLAKEYPQHPTTPKFYNKVKYADSNMKNLGSLQNKMFGLKVITYATQSKTLKIECWVDLDGVVNGKPSNNWKLFYTAEDDGSWAGPPYLENQGIANNDKAMGWYVRIDTVKKKTDAKFLGGREIEISSSA